MMIARKTRAAVAMVACALAFGCVRSARAAEEAPAAPQADGHAASLKAQLVRNARGLVGKRATVRIGAAPSERYRVTSIDESGVRAEGRGVEVNASWERLGNEGLYVLALSLADGAPERFQAECLLLGVALGRADEPSFEKVFASLRAKDRAAAEGVDAAVAAARRAERERRAAEAEVAKLSRKLSDARAPVRAAPREMREFVPLQATVKRADIEKAKPAPAGAEKLVLERPEMAGMSGLRDAWDRPVVLEEGGAAREVDKGRFGKAPSADWSGTRPGAPVFDAAHRSMLVRFPGSARAIADRMGKGLRVARAEIVLTFKGTELWPIGYVEPAGLSFLGDTWANWKPRWHAVAWSLRKPWRADPRFGPTFNAHANGAGYWARFGARDTEQDRFPGGFGPAEVSSQSPEGRLDVTAAFTGEEFGADAGARLRTFEDCGLVVQKWEVYDAALWQGGYEWQTATGPRGILVGAPRLEVAFEKSRPEKVDLPPARAPERRGRPTAVVPSEADFAGFAARFGFKRPDWMPDWQWRRVSELKALGGGKTFPTTYQGYLAWLDGMNGLLPRRWSGFDAGEQAQEYLLYYDAIPEPVRDHFKLYWWAWLMPERDIKELVQGCIGGAQAQEYYKRTFDWRGNFSVYRTYCHEMGTMNFNHWATAGTLLGGAIIGSERCVADGRHGLEHWPLRTWCYFDGSTQESIDHYYFAISLAMQKVFADLGPSHLDRMMGESILAKSVEELTSSYHPGLRRFVSSGGRTGIAYLLAIQDGLQHIVHSLSEEGALTDVGGAPPGGMPALGHDKMPGAIALQTLNGPWAPEWASNMVDRKPIPYEMTVGYKQWGGYSATPLWRRTFLGANYGMASLDVSVGNETVPVMAEWRRAARKVERAAELGTMVMRYGINRTDLLDSMYHGTTNRNPNGCVGTQGGHVVTMQHRNRMIVLTSPYRDLNYPGGRPVPDKVTSLQTTVGLMNFEPRPSWEIWAAGKRVTSFPAKLSMNDRILVKDGVSYLALIPVPATDLGRDAEVVISSDGVETEMQGGGKAKEALRIDAYNYRSERPAAGLVGTDRLDLAYGGFVVEMGDETEHGDFAAFRKHVEQAKLVTRWEPGAKTLHVAYRSGADVMELGYRPDYGGDWNRKVPTDQAFPYRRVNGGWPYLAKDMDRDSTLTQQGRSGRLEKNGAVLTCEPGRMAYLQTEPVSGTYAGFNPFPDPTDWALAVPGGVKVAADGKVGLLRAVVRPGEGKVWIDHAFRPADMNRPGLARYVLVSGLRGQPEIVLNGERLEKVGKAGGAWAVPVGAAPGGD